MNTKTFSLVVGIFLLGILSSGIASAEYAGTLNENTSISIDNFIAGNTAEADFSFSYNDYYGDSEYPHIFRINISSDDADYPVWKGDFELSGYVRKSTFFGVFHEEIALNCSESPSLTIEHPLGTNTLAVPNGTFYCYNTTSDKIQNLDKNDEVFLSLKSNIALYPGDYSLTAEIFYLDDTKAPVVLIQNKANFENNYYRDFSDIEVIAEISDGSLITNRWGTIYTTPEITVPFSHSAGGLDYFSKTLPADIPEGEFPLYIFATDSDGNTGNDSTTLRTDLTGPEIEIIRPSEAVILSEMDPILYIEMDVTDAKAGVKTDSVEYLLSEMDGTSLCPEDGVGTWDCYSSGWTELPLVGDTYYTEINTTEIGLTSGEYWLRVRAEDILGNRGVLE